VLLTKKLVRSLMVAMCAATVGCQSIAGLEDRRTDPPRSVCALPTAGDAKLRFANFVPSNDAVDICIRRAGGEFGRPLLRGIGTEWEGFTSNQEVRCPAGFAYSQVTAPFGVPSGTLEVKVIPAGSKCDARALSQGTVEVGKGTVTTVARIGSDAVGESVRIYPDSVRPPQSGTVRFRLAHVSPSSPPLDIGFTSSEKLPAQLDSVMLQSPLSFGEATTSGTQTAFSHIGVDPDGYLETTATSYNIGAAPTGEKRATVATLLPPLEVPQTVYFIGDPTQPYFPVRALTCNEASSQGLFTECRLSGLGTIKVGIFNAYLYGSFAKDEALRVDPVAQAISQHDADLMCITSITRAAHQAKVIAAAEATFPYSITAATDLDTQPTEPQNQLGESPVPYTVPACGGGNDPAKVDAVLDCMQSKCSTTGTPEGQNQGGSDCFSANCVAPLLPLISGTKEEQRCFNCLVISQLADETHARTREICNTDLRDYMAFDGATDSLVLSKYPLSDVETFVLPTTGYRRVVHYAKVKIDLEKDPIDFFCAELSAAFGRLVPYHGFYAPDAATDPWLQEQLWQTQQVIDYVKRKSSGRPAIIAGDWATSEEWINPQGMKHVDDQNPEVIRLLNGQLVPAVPPDYQPLCTECASTQSTCTQCTANAYNEALNVWQLRTYLWNMEPSDAAAARLFFTEPVTVPTGQTLPLSDRWGYEVEIKRP
jgi:hypothetical protein